VRTVDYILRESTARPGGGGTMDLSSKIASYLYLSVGKPIGDEAEACRTSMKHIMEDRAVSHQQAAATGVAVIARHIKQIC
jgi:hypothetical protein